MATRQCSHDNNDDDGDDDDDDNDDDDEGVHINLGRGKKPPRPIVGVLTAWLLVLEDD